jgi:hypothetical protein
MPVFESLANFLATATPDSKVLVNMHAAGTRMVAWNRANAGLPAPLECVTFVTSLLLALGS